MRSMKVEWFGNETGYMKKVLRPVVPEAYV